MSYLLYGEDTFRSRAKLKAIMNRYIDASLGDTNLAVIDGAQTKPDVIIRQLWTMPFFTPKRLVVIENLLTQGNNQTQKEINDFLPKIPLTTVAVFYEAGLPDKRLALFHSLNQSKFAQEYSLLEGIKLINWAKKRFQENGATIEPTALQSLLKITGPDLWRLDQEINKLSLFAPDHISSDTVDLLTHKDPTGDIFQCLDALAHRQTSSALKHLHARLELGDAPLYLLSMFVYSFRTLLIIQDILFRNPHRSSSPSISPYVWRKTVTQAKSFSLPLTRAIYRYLMELDYAIKTGIIEPRVALDLFVFELCVGTLKEGSIGELAFNQASG